jgi:hypothetical protein
MDLFISPVQQIVKKIVRWNCYGRGSRTGRSAVAAL